MPASAPARARHRPDPRRGSEHGEFARHVFGLGYSGRIVSFEPLSSAYSVLLAEARLEPRWEVAERCCLGEGEGEVEINVSENSISSSLLPIRPEHVGVSREARYVSREKVRMRPLDAVAPRYLEGSRAPFLKLDVQGYEFQVLQGARETLPRIRGLQVELSVCAVYEGQTLFLPLVSRIASLGFTPYRFTPSFVDPRTGRWLQADGLFFRER